MASHKFTMEFERQKDSGEFDLVRLSFALIEEASGVNGISDESFEKLLEIFKDSRALNSESFHSLTTSIWSDPDTLSDDQLEQFGTYIANSVFTSISEANAFSLCDMVGSTFTNMRAKEILSKLSEQSALAEAASFSISEIS